MVARRKRHKRERMVEGESFFFQAEDGVRGAQESRGLGDVYKKQLQHSGWNLCW